MVVDGPVVWSTPGATWHREPAPSGVALNMERCLPERSGFPEDSLSSYTPVSRMQTPCRGSAVRWVRPTEVLVTRTPSACSSHLHHPGRKPSASQTPPLTT